MTGPVDVVDTRDVPDDVDVFLDQLTGPTMFRIAGRDRSRCRVVGATLHGNEPSGLRAVHRYLGSGEVPAVDALLFVGAVEAARAEPRYSHRMLPDRRDLNRCFRPPFEGVDGGIAARVLELVRAAKPELVVDLHNNTGRNPAYAVGRTIDGAHLQLAALFCDRFVYSRISLGTFSEAFADLAPSATVECGTAGDPQADATAYAGLVRLLRLDQLDPAGLAPVHMVILEHPVRFCLRAGIGLEFAERPERCPGLTLDLEIDRHNFETVAAGTRFGWVSPAAGWPLEALDASGADVSASWFEIANGELVSRRAFVPFMLTTHVEIARSDCLFYAATRRE